MKKIFIIFDLSHDADDYYDGEVIEYMTNSEVDAIKEMFKKVKFCDSQINNTTWTYHYVLREFELPYDRISSSEGKLVTECKNYKDED